MPVNDGDEGFLASVVGGVEVDVQHGILFPLGFQLADGQPFEELLPPLEVGLQGGDQQALAEPAGTAEEVVFAVIGQLVYQSGLVKIKVSFIDDFRECLYADGVASNGRFFFLFLTCDA